MPIERTGVDWEDLENLAFEVDGQFIQLEGGKAEISYGGASTDLFVLQNRVAQGDLDGDGFEDVVAHITLRSAGSGVFHLLVPVVDDGRGGAAKQPVPVGDRIVVEGIEVRDGLVRVSLLDREPGEPFTVISLRQTLEIDISGPEPAVSVVESMPLEALPLPEAEAPEIDIRFDPGAVGGTVTGSIDFQQRQPYTAYISEGQAFTAILEAPIGVWLDVRLGDRVLTSGSKRFQSVSANLPATGPWRVTVVSTHAGPVDYRLYVEALPRGASPAPVPTPTGPAEPTSVSSAPDSGAGPVLYLTFDDGPHPVYTPRVLEVLSRHGARSTFFVIGSLAEQYPGIIQRINAEGHTVANHTWNHEALAGLPQEVFDDTVGRTQDLLGSRATPCLRPPYGSIDAFTRDWAADHGLDVALWDVDPADWRNPPAAEIAQHIVDHARDGAVVLLHDGGGDRTQTVLALDAALSELSTLGYRFEPLCT
ncbi:MAG: polysaccharide deacetylase family protein [bacterium]|nr:polysaccharide deacetylase family protein [bacterium]